MIGISCAFCDRADLQSASAFCRAFPHEEGERKRRGMGKGHQNNKSINEFQSKHFGGGVGGGFSEVDSLLRICSRRSSSVLIISRMVSRSWQRSSVKCVCFDCCLGWEGEGFMALVFRGGGLGEMELLFVSRRNGVLFCYKCTPLSVKTTYQNRAIFYQNRAFCILQIYQNRASVVCKCLFHS